jgi:serine/threonine protein phosphatase PrpC
MAGIVVADGVGSFYGSNVASLIVTVAIKTYLEADTPLSCVDLMDTFSVSRSALSDHVERRADPLPTGVDLHRAYGTTALCAVDVGDSFKVAYVGNGCLHHLRGNFDQVSQGRLLPSNTANLLNPHCHWYEGRSVLARIISPTTSDADSAPTALQLSQDDLFGDIIVLASDGIYSYDDVQIGRDSQGDVFIEAKRSMVWLYEALSSFLRGDLTEGALQNCLESYLRKLDTNHLVDDDCTVAVLISGRALRYRQSLRAVSAEEFAVTR